MVQALRTFPEMEVTIVGPAVYLYWQGDTVSIFGIGRIDLHTMLLQ